MTWTYHSDTGKLYNPAGAFLATGYSGLDGGRNNPEMEDIHGIGPIPRGRYKIGPAHLDGKLGPVVMNLDPIPPFDALGRTDFRIHGDNSTHDASHGCVILPPWIRKAVSNSGDHILEVL